MLTKPVCSFLVALLVLAACSPVAAPEPAAEAAKAVVVRIGTQPWIGYGPWWIAKEKEMFAKYGLNVELIDFVQDSDVNAALASNQMEAANLATHTAIKLYNAGLDIRIVLLMDASYEADAILTSADIQSIEDLRGRQIAFEEGTTSDLLLSYALMQNGMSIDDVIAVPMPASDTGVTLISDRVEAAVTYEPYITEALNQDPSLTLLYTAAEKPGLISDVLVMRSSFLEDQPGAARALLKVWDEAIAFYRANPEEAKAIIARNVGSKPEELVTAFDGVVFYDLAENRQLLSGEFLNTMQEVARVSQEIGLLSEIPALAKLVDTDFLSD